MKMQPLAKIGESYGVKAENGSSINAETASQQCGWL
jgi:hypothetical protein